MTELAQKGSRVKVHYRGTLKDGHEFDCSYDRGEPIEFIIGAGMMIPGFDQAVEGMGLGEKKSINIEPEEAYGHYKQELCQTYEKEQFQDVPFRLGGQLQVTGDNDVQFIVTVTDLTDTHVTLDANHFLAGKDLNFEIELVEILS